MSEEGFFSRWARRKSEVRSGSASEGPAPKPAPSGQAPAQAASHPAPKATVPPAAGDARVGGAAERPAAPAAEAEPLPSLEDVARLTPDSDYSAFMRQGVDEDVKRAAMKKLFTDPHYNVMDGLDIYIDDYSKPDPIPASMLRKMVQSQLLGLFRDEEAEKEKPAGVADATSVVAPTHDTGQAVVSQSRAEEALPAAPAAGAAAVPNPNSEHDGAALHAASPAQGGSAPPDGRLSDPGAAGQPTDRS